MRAAPFYDAMSFGPPNGAAHWVKTADGVRLRIGHWPHDGARGTVLMFPGRTEYIEKYGDAAAEFRTGGYAMLAIDWRGQGLSARLLDDRALGHVGRFSDYQIDVTAAVDHARELGLPEPYYLVAHSMGGCIGLRAAINGLEVRAAAFSAPMWGITVQPAALRPLSRALAWLAEQTGQADHLAPTQTRETYVLREGFATNTLTRDPDMWARLQAQVRARPDLALGGPTLHWLFESFREMDALHQMPSPDLPALAFLGTDEQIVDPTRIRKRMERWPGSMLHLLEDAGHEVMLEIPATRFTVFQTMIAHFDAHR